MPSSYTVDRFHLGLKGKYKNNFYIEKNAENFFRTGRSCIFMRLGKKGSENRLTRQTTSYTKLKNRQTLGQNIFLTNITHL